MALALPAPASVPAHVNYITITEEFCQALASRTAPHFLETRASEWADLRTRSVVIVKKDAAERTVARLAIDFFENTITTTFEGKELSLKLSIALGFMRDFSNIFSKIRTSGGPERLLAIQNECFEVIQNPRSRQTDLVLEVDGKELVAFYPLIGRVVLEGRISMSLAMIQNCAHLFSTKFAKEISPLLGSEPTVEALQRGVFQLYIGRCVVGLGICLQERLPSQKEPLQRELERILVILMGGEAFYSEPNA